MKYDKTLVHCSPDVICVLASLVRMIAQHQADSFVHYSWMNIQWRLGIVRRIRPIRISNLQDGTVIGSRGVII